jgi:hypothetical protein
MSYTTEVMSIRTGSDNRYTIKPFLAGGYMLLSDECVSSIKQYILSHVKRVSPRGNAGRFPRRWLEHGHILENVPKVCCSPGTLDTVGELTFTPEQEVERDGTLEIKMHRRRRPDTSRPSYDLT